MLRFVAFLVCFHMPAFVLGGSVFLNGVNIDSVKNQSFKNCGVTIDANGNVLITAKGVAVSGGSAKAKTPVAPTEIGAPPTRRYFLVTEKAVPGMAQYDFDVFINAKWVRKLLDSEEHIVLEVTKYLLQGNNKVRLMARKTLGSEPRRSSSARHYFRVVMGEGNSGGRNIMITKKFIDFKVSAFDVKNQTKEYTIMVY